VLFILEQVFGRSDKLDLIHENRDYIFFCAILNLLLVKSSYDLIYTVQHFCSQVFSLVTGIYFRILLLYVLA